MGTKLQLDLIKKNNQCVELATIMANTVYPRLVDLMTKLGMEEIRFEEIKGLKHCCFTIDYKIHFFNISEGDKHKEKKDIYEIKCKGKVICPYFDKELGNVKEFQSPSEKYLPFCMAAINSLNVLEKKLLEIDEVLEVARNISMPLNRIVLTEKSKN